MRGCLRLPVVLNSLRETNHLAIWENGDTLTSFARARHYAPYVT